MALQENLKALGLSPSESAIYLFLLENGASRPPEIAKGTGITRTNCYYVLENLKGLGLVQEEARGKRKAYIARDPESLYSSLERKRELIAQILPDLRALHTTQKNKPKIRFYDGWEEVKQIYEETLRAKEIRALGSTKQLNAVDAKFFAHYIRELRERKIVFWDILTPASGTGETPQLKDVLRGFYAVEHLPAKYQDFPTDMLLWDRNIALISLEEPIFGTVLTNKALAETFKIMFTLIWERLA